MTGDHVQDLLLDLAYGELPAERAAEVEAHLATCEVCRAERDDIVRTRALVAPLRSVEEPRAGFDERIVQSARAEAGLQADGTPGPTIEVSGSVKPLGLQAARVDPLAPGVKVAQKEVSKRSIWRRRATVGASVAGAAAVALIVATSVTQKHEDRSAEVPELKVRAPGVAGEPVPAASPVPARRVDRFEPPPPPPSATPQGSGGDLAAPSSGPVVAAEPAARKSLDAAKKAEDAVREKTAVAPSARDDKEPMPAAGSAKTFEDAKPVQPPPSFREAARETSAAPAAPAPAAKPPQPEIAQKQRAAVAQANGSAVGGQPLSPVPATGLSGTTAPANPDPDQLEESAGAARRAGSYQRAAELYQLSSGLRRAKNDPSRAAWDLAHAVECLAAASKIHEAGDVRAELMRSYPGEEGPLRAANRALGWPAAPPR